VRVVNAFHPFLIALQFLTRLPVRLSGTPSNQAVGRSLLYYPLVGLILGLALALLNILLADTPTLLRAALLLGAWVVLTGALHLDGLADSADAWIGGLGDRKRTLAIMKDPYCGPVAVVTLTTVLLIKFAALNSFGAHNWILLVAIPVLARSTVPLLFLTTPYVRPGGLGTKLAKFLPRSAAIVTTIATCIAVVWITDFAARWMLVAVGATFMLLRHMMTSRIGGTTGDTAGAMIELTETAALIGAVAVLN
jgi:adenosylcobinamide-GDP ribazoletransferase